MVLQNNNYTILIDFVITNDTGLELARVPT